MRISRCGLMPKITPIVQDKFHLPLGENGEPLIYFAGNSLGLMPKQRGSWSNRSWKTGRSSAWMRISEAETPWYTYHGEPAGADGAGRRRNRSSHLYEQPR